MGRKKNGKNKNNWNSSLPGKAEQTRMGLIEVVSKIMKENGHTFLKTMKITRRMGRNKNIIIYHYKNLNDLLKTYIRQKDYWPGFFERFKQVENPGQNEIMGLFSELMQDNLKLLQVTPEMQKIILWQISEASPMLKSVSEDREKEGANVIALAKPFFDGSDVNFNAVLALILGGSYYLVLHNETNKSTVCGIDINRDRDKELVLKTIGQMISWAFEKAFPKQAS